MIGRSSPSPLFREGFHCLMEVASLMRHLIVWSSDQGCTLAAPGRHWAIKKYWFLHQTQYAGCLGFQELRGLGAQLLLLEYSLVRCFDVLSCCPTVLKDSRSFPGLVFFNLGTKHSDGLANAIFLALFTLNVVNNTT